MKDALSIHRLLLERQTAHEIVRLPHLITSADELPEVLGLPPDRCLCTRLYADAACAGCLLAAVIVPAGTWPASGAVADTLDVEAVAPASADLVNEATDYAADLVAPLMLPDDITTLVDEKVAGGDEVVYTATGEPSTALGIRTPDLFEICGAKPVPIPHGTDESPRNRAEQ
jgi:prolyl-tRNA editing enzyme YbaK/EbsC (Cys-tRNA(Pro) deacylase)